MRARQYTLSDATPAGAVMAARSGATAGRDRHSDPDWTSTPKPAVVTAEHVAFAWVLLMDLEAQHAPRERVNEARRRAKALTRRWKLAMGAEAGRHEGREVPGGSMTSEYVGAHQSVNKRNENATMRKS